MNITVIWVEMQIPLGEAVVDNRDNLRIDRVI